MSTLADLVTVGYTVDQDGDLAAVRGLGVATVIQTDDQTAIDSLYAAATAPPPAPPPSPGPTVQEKVAAALQTIQSDNGTNPVTADQLATVIQALTS